MQIVVIKHYLLHKYYGCHPPCWRFNQGNMYTITMIDERDADLKILSNQERCSFSLCKSRIADKNDWQLWYEMTQFIPPHSGIQNYGRTI